MGRTCSALRNWSISTLVACLCHTEGLWLYSALFSLDLGVGHKKATRGNAHSGEPQDWEVPRGT